MIDTVLLTGATADIGEEIAIEISKHYNIVLSGRNTRKLEALKEKISTTNKVFILPLDLSNFENFEEKIITFISHNQLTIEKFVHCAGFMKMVPLKLVSQDLILETFKTNVFSANIIIKLLCNKKIKR